MLRRGGNIVAAMQKKLPQPMRPSGTVGKVFGWIMARINAPSYRWTVEQLKPVQPKSFLEIGFGTGHLLALVAKTFKPAKIAGVDPSPLMVETARKRLRRFRKKMQIELKQGDDSTLPKDGPYDAIAALHCFQFWAHPATSLAEIRHLLSPNGRFVLVLRVGFSRRVAKEIPNPISREPNEISEVCKAAEQAGFVILAMRGLSKTSHGIVLGCG